MEAQNIIQKDALIDAAIGVFVKYGARKTTMADIAAAAEVSRQTLYDLVGGKNEFIVASIQTITDRNLSRVYDRLDSAASLEDKLAVYFEETVVSSFKLLQTSGDPEDLISGHNEAGKEEITRSHQKHRKLIEDLLTPCKAEIIASGHQLKDVAEFLVISVMALKYQAANLKALHRMLEVLSDGVVALTKG